MLEAVNDQILSFFFFQGVYPMELKHKWRVVCQTKVILPGEHQQENWLVLSKE